MAAATAMPPDPPIRMPSTSDTRRAVRKLSSSLMAMISSYRSGSHAVGRILADALDEVRPAGPAGEHRPSGSAATIRMAGFCALR